VAKPTIDDRHAQDDEWDDAADGDWDYDEDWEDEDYVYVPEQSGLVRKFLAVFVLLVVFVFLVLGLGGYWLFSQVNPGGTQTQEVAFVIPKDAGLATISRLLEEKEIITNATIFRYYAKWKNIPTIRAGSYDKLYKNDSMDHVLERLKQGPLPPKFSEVAVPEGLWVVDVMATIKKKFPEMNDVELGLSIQSVKSKYQPKDKELVGFMFPATYRVEDDDKDNEQKLVDQMVKKFDQVGDELGLADPAAKFGQAAGKVTITPYDVVTIASLIEAEAKLEEDRGRISRVIYNRLKADMPLQIDAAIFVALGGHKPEITKSDLEIDSPYNLRNRKGLPPTPINNPGRSALAAALNPSGEPGSDKWLYYVLMDKEGHHLFTGNYNEFLRQQEKSRAEGLL